MTYYPVCETAEARMWSPIENHMAGEAPCRYPFRLFERIPERRYPDCLFGTTLSSYLQKDCQYSNSHRPNGCPAVPATSQTILMQQQAHEPERAGKRK